jgi:hypothetical protein
MSLAEVMRLTGRSGDSRRAAAEAARVAQQKGNLVAVRRAEELLARLDEPGEPA